MNSCDYKAELRAAVHGLPASLQPAVDQWLDDVIESLPADVSVTDAPPAGVVRLAALSEFAAGILKRETAHFFAEGVAPFAVPERSVLLADALMLARTTGGRAAFMRELRRFRNRGLVCILWRDLVLDGEVVASLEALSDLAEACLDAALEFAAGQLADRFGRPVGSDGPMPLVTLAMGKLGGRELNFSSDIDLVFLYPGECDTDGRRQISAGEYFTKLAREIVALLEEVTADGFVYRVDTRLRPFGASGPPVVSFAALESYLVEHGRGWERYAYVKARPITATCSTPEATRLMQEIVHPFVYRRYLDYGVFESLRDLHGLIAVEVRKKEMQDNIKLGPGGIREIEFIVQSLQLVRGGSVHELQTTSLREAMGAAVNDSDLTANVAGMLIDAYDFLRRVENAVQGMRDRQTHDLPDKSLDRDRLAFALRASDWNQLDDRIRATRAWVSEQFQAIGIRDDDAPGEDEQRAELQGLWASGADVVEWTGALHKLGLADAGAAAEVVVDFGKRESLRRIDATAARRLRRFIAGLVLALPGAEQPVVALQRVVDIADSIVRRSAYLSLLNENPAVLERLVELCESSVYLAGELARYPVLLDELIDARIFVEPPTPEDIDEELQSALKNVDPLDFEARVEALAEFKRAILFRLAVADFSGSIPIMKVSDRLTEVAECVLKEALAAAHDDLRRQFGEPQYAIDGEIQAAGLGVIAYGKLAGYELSYGSDLDLVFIHDSKGERQQTNGERVIENQVYFSRLVRRLVHFLTTQTGSGALYEIDTRLRPSGHSGLLVTSVDAFERYQEENAWTWEHQALLRSRPVAGSQAVAEGFARVRSTTLRRRVRRDSLREDVLDMRRKMREQLDRSDGDAFDLKQGRGGVADIEFLVQYLVLRHADDTPAVIAYPDNIRQLDALAAGGYLDAATAARLQDIYRDYRAQMHHLALDRKPAIAGGGAFVADRAFVSSIWDEVFALSPE